MKRHKNLYGGLCSFDNLFLAARKARKGKSLKPAVLAFDDRLETNLLDLQNELQTKTYQPGKYKPFWVCDKGKERHISAAPYRDRVVHHAIINVIGPLFEAGFIHDSYANRKEKGTHKAASRCQLFCRKNRYVLKCDIYKYFPSIDHVILKKLIRRKIADKELLWLIDTVIDAGNPQEPVLLHFSGDDLFTPLERRRGIPIGNLTSQFFANIYLNGFDHYVKETLGQKYYARYVDDFVCFGNDKNALHAVRHAMEAYLEKLRLAMHPKKCRVFPIKSGVPFLGFRIYPYYKRLDKKNSMAFRKTIRKYQRRFTAGKMTHAEVARSIRGWIAHASQANTYNLRKSIVSEVVFSRNECVRK